MQITPRYGEPPALQLHVPVDDPAVALLRQRRRLGDLLASLDEQQWGAASRCEKWSVRDVIAHLNGTNQFWTISIAAGLRGEPTRFLAAFDPVATPAQMVEELRSLSSADVLAQYREGVEQLADVVTGLDAAAWSMLGEAPPGHIALHALAAHALWDAWIHERDVALPLGLAQPPERDEVVACLRYAAAIGPALLASSGSTGRGTLTVVASDPDISFVVEIGTSAVVRDGEADGPRLSGDAVALIEGLSYRAPLRHALEPDDVWLLAGLGEVFDVAPAER